MNTQVKSAAIGISIELLKKSNISNIVIPPTETALHTPKPSDEGMPSKRVPTYTIKLDFLRDKWNLSITIDTTVSISDIAEVNAGNATNISPGPCPKVSGLPPEKVYAAGIIISPDSNAIPVSKTSIWCTDDSILSCFFIYEP